MFAKRLLYAFYILRTTQVTSKCMTITFILHLLKYNVIGSHLRLGLRYLLSPPSICVRGTTLREVRVRGDQGGKRELFSNSGLC